MMHSLVWTALLACVSAKTVNLDWHLGWRWLAPDGNGRPVVVVNGQWPPPDVVVDYGDRIVAKVTNDLGNETTSIHWHGMYQFGSIEMDGPVMVTQCPIAPGQTFEYDFTVLQIGTYWWHSHAPGQIADGLRGKLIVNDPNAPFRNKVTAGNLAISVADWYQDQAPFLINYYQSAQNEDDGGPEPIPTSGLVNDGQNITVDVEPNETYLLHLMNIGNFVGVTLEIDDHTMTVVEADGIYVDPIETDRIYLAVGQRYGVLLTTKTKGDKNFLIRAQLDTSMFDSIPDDYNPNAYGYLTYCDKSPLPQQTPISNLTTFDDLDLVTSRTNVGVDVEAYDHVDRQIFLDMNFTSINGQNRAIVNNVTYVPQDVPTLYTALTTGKDALNPEVYGTGAIPFVIKNGEIIEVVVNNYDEGDHPWHLHGHTFQVIARSNAGAGFYNGGQQLQPPHARPLQRDTVTVYAGGFLAIRFKADNPGVHIMHCHIEWHVVAGLTVTFIESPDIMQQTIQIPSDHLASCKALGISTAGNAAGNTKDFLNLTGAPTEAAQDPFGALLNSTAAPPPSKHHAFWTKHSHHYSV